MDRDVVIDAVAGFVAGASVTLAFQPVDTVLTRQQYATAPQSAGATALALLRGKGGLAFWRGATPLVALVLARRGNRTSRRLRDAFSFLGAIAATPRPRCG